MFEAFVEYITSQVELNPDELSLIRSLSVPRKLRKRQFLLQEGDVCRHACFVSKGLIRTYRVGDDGTEHSLCFSAEQQWSSDWESYVDESPAYNNLVALEDAEILLWTKANFERILDEIPAMALWFKNFVADSLKANHARIYMHISQSTEEKYENFVRKSPDLHARVPLHMIASYLGVTRETLSRVRSIYAHK